MPDQKRRAKYKVVQSAMPWIDELPALASALLPPHAIDLSIQTALSD
jgi:hypothetical protein